MNTLNIAMLLEHAARQVPDKTYIIAGERGFTFGQINAKAQRFANVLARLGVEPGQKVALLLPNVPVFPICYYGALKLGAVPVPLTVLAPGPEVAYLLRHSEAVVLAAWEPLAKAAVEGFNAAEGCRHLILTNLPGSDACLSPAQRLEELMAAAKETFSTAPTQPEEAAVILYTSGTTGRPKGSILTHFNYYFFSYLLARDLWRLGPDDVMLMVAPASHIFGQAMVNVACVVQAELSLMARFDPETFLRTIERDKVTFIAGVPTLAHFLLHAPQVDRYDLSSLRVAMFSGAPMPPEMVERFKSRFQADVITGYGLTEAVPVTFVTADMQNVPPGSAGTPVLGTTVRIVNEEDQDVPAGEIGEIVVRGPQVFREYHNWPEGSAAALRDGWFHTGDVGCMDKDGYLFIVDRLQDMIKTSGYAVFPAEVERVLYAHPAVAEAAVVGVPHEALGELVTAFVTLKPGATASARELSAHCKAQLASYKCPRHFEFRGNLPKSPAGKILRRLLREA